jgi:hypothetical protein
VLRSKSSPTERRVVPYCCHSWRHSGPCSEYKKRETFRRIKTALEPEHPASVLFCVVTYDQKRFERGLAMVDLFVSLARFGGVHYGLFDPDPRELAYLVLWRCWQSFIQAINRRALRSGGERLRYVQTVEQHKTGWPHANAILVSSWLAGELVGQDAVHDCVRKRRDSKGAIMAGVRCGHPGCVRDWLSDLAVRCKLGKRVTLDVAFSKDQVAGYVAKLAAERFDGAQVAGEVSKQSQMPVAAPLRFRRVRASWRFLPPVFKDPDTTGEIVRSPADQVQLVLERGADLPLSALPRHWRVLSPPVFEGLLERSVLRDTVLRIAQEGFW